MWQLPLSGTQLVALTVNCAAPGPDPVNVTVPSLTGWLRNAVRVVVCAVVGVAGLLIRERVRAPPVTLTVVVFVTGAYWLLPDQEAVTAHTPAVVGVQVMKQLPALGVQVWPAAVAPLGPEKAKVTMPPLACAPSVAVSVCADPAAGDVGLPAIRRLVVRPVTVIGRVMVTVAYCLLPE